MDLRGFGLEISVAPHGNSEESKPEVKEQIQEVVKRKHNLEEKKHKLEALLRQDVADQFLLSTEVVSHRNRLLFTSPHQALLNKLSSGAKASRSSGDTVNHTLM